MKTPAIPGIRGLMLDPARLIERHAFYFDMLPFMQRWGLNTLWWHGSDDQGFVLKLAGHPELATPHAFTKAEMRRFIAAAQARGIDVVPEVESLGHARYITRLPRYAHLRNGDPRHFNAICPSHPDTLPLLREVIEEVADLFPSPYFHVGLDEVDFAGCRRCAGRGRNRPAGWVYVQHVRAVHAVVAACGKRMVMWADHVEREPAMLASLPPDIVLAHWQYTDVRPAAIRRSLAAGFDVICVPALCHWGDVIQPNVGNLRNMETMTRTVAGLGGRPLGMVNSWWTAWRGFRDAYLFAAAYTGRLMNAGPAVGRRRVAREFAADHYGIADAAAADALLRLHDVGITLHELSAMLFDSESDMADLLDLSRDGAFERRLQTATDCAARLAAAAPQVKRNRAGFEACLLAARVAEACLDHAPKMREFHRLCREAGRLRDQDGGLARALPTARQAIQVLEALHARMQALCRAADRDWDRTRHPDDPIKGLRHRPSTPCSREMLLGRMYRCRDYLERRLADLRFRCRRPRAATLLP